MAAVKVRMRLSARKHLPMIMRAALKKSGAAVLRTVANDGVMYTLL